MATDFRRLLRRQLPVLGVFVLFLPLWTLYLHGAVCIEGGTVVGFPWMFYNRCYGPPVPGGGPSVDAPELLPIPLVVDIVFWYVVSAAAVFVVRLLQRR